MLVTGHWPEIARRWDQVGPPLRPSVLDAAICTSVIDAWARAHGAPRALILGVTPELYRLPWPPGSEVTAIDHTPGMIEALWPGLPSGVVCADWTDMPLEPASRDLALCDGGMHLLPYPHGHHRLVRRLHDVLAQDGLCVFRLFVPPSQRERAEAVLGELLAGNIRNPNVLKLRLGMALQEDSESGVQLGHIWEVLHRAVPDLGRLAERIGCPAEPWLAINTYRSCPNRYHFLTVEQVRDLFCEDPGGFSLQTVRVPACELGARRPTVIFQRGSGQK